jgi:hypothetical protein
VTIPHRRLNDEPAVARLFIYATGWNPPRALSGYRARTCDE